MKKFLLDTHILIWADLEPGRISSRARRIVENPSNELWLSPISTWEAARLVDDGAIRIGMPFEEWFAAIASALALQEAPLTHDVVLAAREVSLPHKDPADRLIAATARHYGLHLITADDRVLEGSGFPVVAG